MCSPSFLVFSSAFLLSLRFPVTHVDMLGIYMDPVCYSEAGRQGEFIWILPCMAPSQSRHVIAFSCQTSAESVVRTDYLMCFFPLFQSIIIPSHVYA